MEKEIIKKEKIENKVKEIERKGIFLQGRL